MFRKPLLMIPGPTPCPDVVLRAQSEQMINHRSSEYSALQHEVIHGLKQAFKSQNDVLVFPASGTGGLEAAIVNTLCPGDRALAITCGAFGDRFAAIARAHGVDVCVEEVEWGRAASPDVVFERLSSDREYRALLVTHNETSTGVLTDLARVAEAARSAQPDILILVDSISGVLTADLRPDEWDLDVVVAGSQKAWMTPPGLTFMTVSARAWEVNRSCTAPRFYFDFAQMKNWTDKGQTPYTPAVATIRGLREALRLILAEGIDECVARHVELGSAVRSGVSALGLSLFAAPQFYSNAVTAVRVPEGVSSQALRGRLRDEFGIVIAGAPSRLSDTVFRIGHLGNISRADVLATLGGLEVCLRGLGLRTTEGAGVGAAATIFERPERAAA